MVRDSFTAPVTSPAAQFNVSDTTALDWLRNTVAAGGTSSVGTAVITSECNECSIHSRHAL